MAHIALVTAAGERRIRPGSGPRRSTGDSLFELMAHAGPRPAPASRARPVLLRLGEGAEAVDALRIDVAVKLYGYDGACVMLDAMVRTLGMAATCARLAHLAERCQRLGGVLAIVTKRPATALAPVLVALQPCCLGRKRRTTSIRAISMPSGGSGNLPTSTS